MLPPPSHSITKSYRFYLLDISLIKTILYISTTTILVQTAIIFHLDCCNRLFSDHPKAPPAQLQSVLHVAAKVIFKKCTPEHIIPLLKILDIFSLLLV